MAGSKKLATNVQVDGTWYGPAFADREDGGQPSADVAKKIDNPDVWESSDSKSSGS